MQRSNHSTLFLLNLTRCPEISFKTYLQAESQIWKRDFSFSQHESKVLHINPWSRMHLSMQTFLGVGNIFPETKHNISDYCINVWKDDAVSEAETDVFL